MMTREMAEADMYRRRAESCRERLVRADTTIAAIRAFVMGDGLYTDYEDAKEKLLTILNTNIKEK